jgi:hypothetical protein
MSFTLDEVDRIGDRDLKGSSPPIIAEDELLLGRVRRAYNQGDHRGSIRGLGGLVETAVSGI